MSYLNTTGGGSPRFETTGHAFKEIYNPGDGAYRFLTSSVLGAAGDTITWNPALTIAGNGDVLVNRMCDINGVNCWDPASQPQGGSSLPNCSDGQILVAQGGSWNCSTPAAPQTPDPSPSSPWYPAVDQSCSASCGAQGLVADNRCWSGENKLTGTPNGITFPWGQWGTYGTIGIQRTDGMCYAGGQLQDNDVTDITVACYCATNPSPIYPRTSPPPPREDIENGR